MFILMWNRKPNIHHDVRFNSRLSSARETDAHDPAPYDYLCLVGVSTLQPSFRHQMNAKKFKRSHDITISDCFLLTLEILYWLFRPRNEQSNTPLTRRCCRYCSYTKRANPPKICFRAVGAVILLTPPDLHDLREFFRENDIVACLEWATVLIATFKHIAPYDIDIL